MANHGTLVDLALVRVNEFSSTRKGHVVDVLVDFVGCHTDSAVADGDGLFLFVNVDVNAEVAEFPREFAEVAQRFKLVGGVDRVRNQFAKENFVVAVEKFLDDGKDVVRRYIDFTCSHFLIV